MSGDEQRPVPSPDFVAEVAGNGDGEGEVRLEEDFSGRRGAGRGDDSSVEGGQQTEDVEGQADVASSDTEGGLVRNEVEGQSLSLPSSAHADVSQADGGPDQDEGKTSEGEEPSEDVTALGREANVSQETKGKLDDDAPERAALLVDVGEELGGHVALGHGLHAAGRAVGARVGDAKNGDGDDGVEDGGQDLDLGVLDGEDEGGGLGVGTAGTHQALIVGADDQAKNEQVDDVKDGNSPEDLLAGSGNGLAGVDRLSSSETDELSATKGESGDDEDTAETVEAIPECAGVAPVLGTEVSLVASSAAVDDDTEDDEAGTSEDLDDAKNEFDYKGEHIFVSQNIGKRGGRRRRKTDLLRIP